MVSEHKYSLAVWTEHFLGTDERCRSFLELVEALDGGCYLPDKWGHFEPIKNTFGPTAVESIAAACPTFGIRAIQAACKRLAEAESPLLVRASRKPAAYDLAPESDDTALPGLG